MKRMDFTFPVNLWKDDEIVHISAFYAPNAISEDEVAEKICMKRTTICNTMKSPDPRIVVLDAVEADKLEQIMQTA